MVNRAIAVLTRKSAKEIIEAGGSGSWVLNPENAKRQRYLVCCRNPHGAEFDAPEPARAAFLVGVIGELVPVGETAWGQHRYRIGITECCRVLVPDVWRNWRNPVRYTSLEELGIDVDTLEFTRLEEAVDAVPKPPRVQQERKRLGKPTLTEAIAEAKEDLAAALGISPDAIEIIIRG
ncbi:hypothetical protein BH23PLA1_BH23PLA1_42670 [soil metagenome]